MATVISFPDRRAIPVMPSHAAAPYAPPWFDFKPPRTPATNPRNRYDAAFKGQMAKRANELCHALSLALHSRAQCPGHVADRIEWVMKEIRAIRDEVARTRQDHQPPAAS
jgi:hypothetical protein